MSSTDKRQERSKKLAVKRLFELLCKPGVLRIIIRCGTAVYWLAKALLALKKLFWH